MPIPDRIREAPELMLGLQLYIGAWLDLSSCRQSGWTEGPIPWPEVEQYGRLLELDEETIADLHHHIRAMDNVYLKHQEARRDSG
jgi:hypothetical protein